jgi:hypothetical protein
LLEYNAKEGGSNRMTYVHTAGAAYMGSANLLFFFLFTLERKRIWSKAHSIDGHVLYKSASKRVFMSG